MSANDFWAPSWVYVGMPVWSPCDVGTDAFGRSIALSTQALRCVVTVATGDFARVENATHEYSKLMPLSELRVPKRPDPVDPYLCLPETP